MKNRILNIICFICAVSLMLSCFTASAMSPHLDKPVGKMSAIYGEVFNKYLLDYGPLSTNIPGETIYGEYGYPVAPRGVIYGEVVNFDANENPYLVIYTVDNSVCETACHIWHFDEETEEANEIAVLAKNYAELPAEMNGEFNVGWKGDKRYISYKVYMNHEEISADYYTVINGDTFMYVNDPENVTEVGIADFNAFYFHPGVDVSNGNRLLTDFFDSLKNAAADSVTYEDIAERLSDKDEAQVEATLSNAAKYDYFDIANYSSFVRYEAALDSLKLNSDRFYLISNMYNLGDEIYYVRFSTDKTYYNYALLRRSPDAENGYQILKVCTDCIPLADIELREIKEKYKRNILLYKKAKGNIKLERKSKYIKDTPMPTTSVDAGSAEAKPNSEPKIKITKMIGRHMRLPVACIGGGISIGLLTALWLYLSSDDDKSK